MFEHEGWHIAIRQRGEETSDIRLRLALPDSRGYFAAVAGIAAGEYRVERALAEAGHQPDAGYVAFTADALQAFGHAIRGALRRRARGGLLDEMYEIVTALFSQLVTHFAYLAALASAEQGNPLANSADDLAWERYVGSEWPKIVAGFERFPSAAVPLARQELDALVFELAEVTREWLECIGFTLQDVDDGGIYFQIVRQDF